MTHELTLTADLMTKVMELAEREGAEAVSVVRVRLGALCGVSPEHFREHWEHAARGTIADGAQLEITESADAGDPHAQSILLESVDAELPG